MAIHRIRAYVDTSVFGGVCDEEFAEHTRRFLDQAVRGELTLLISSLTAEELAGAPETVQGVLSLFPADRIERVSVTAEVEQLAAEYVAAGAVGPASLADATHVAAATVAAADLIASWNFRHIVNYRRIRLFNSVNIRLGYRTLMILSPREVANVGPEQDL